MILYFSAISRFVTASSNRVTWSHGRVILVTSHWQCLLEDNISLRPFYPTPIPGKLQPTQMCNL